MNWLAHAFLSSMDHEFQLGNLMADIVKGQELHGMPPGFLRGVRCHKAIDAFTDRHQTVRRSCARISSDYRRFSGVLVDVFYDHFLALNWDRYSSMPLPEFTTSLYETLENYRPALSERARTVAGHIIAEDFLGSYRQIEGIETALRRIAQRLSVRTNRDIALAGAIAELEGNYQELSGDFDEFFPLLQNHVRLGFLDGEGNSWERTGGLLRG